MTEPATPLLLPGDRIAVVSPASAAKSERVHAGADALRQLGFAPVLMPHALASGPLYYAGTLQQRLDDLHAAFADPSIRAIACTRGGWGSAELLPFLDLDLIRHNPKPFLGYSDHTALHTWLQDRAGLTTFHAPMLSPDFARGLDLGVHLPSFYAALTAAVPWQLGPEVGLRLLRPALATSRAASKTEAASSADRQPVRPASAAASPPPSASLSASASAPLATAPPATILSGTLWGGCLAILVEALGTPFAPRPRPGSLLFLEDVGVKPYQWDRMLLHLRYAGLLDGVEAILFGDMLQCAPAAEQPALEASLLHALRDFPGPLLIGLQSGHVDTPNVTLPLNTPATLDLSNPRHPLLHFPHPTPTCDAIPGHPQSRRQ